MAKNLRQDETVAMEQDTFSGRRPELAPPPAPAPPPEVNLPTSIGMGSPRRAIKKTRPGTRTRDIDPPEVRPPGPGTIMPGSFATPAIPASMTPFRTPLFRAQRMSPFSMSSGGFGGGEGLQPEDEIDEYLRRFGGQ